MINEALEERVVLNSFGNRDGKHSVQQNTSISAAAVAVAHDAVDFSDVMEERRTGEDTKGQSVHE